MVLRKEEEAVSPDRIFSRLFLLLGYRLLCYFQDALLLVYRFFRCRLRSNQMKMRLVGIDIRELVLAWDPSFDIRDLVAAGRNLQRKVEDLEGRKVRRKRGAV
jgi:hypothetical protein